MPNVNPSYIPRCCKHKGTGQAVVRLNGRDHYLGRYGSAAARVAYERVVSEWLAHGRRLPENETGLTVAELILAFWRFAQTYYKRGRPGDGTGELDCIRNAVRPLKQLYGRKPVAAFGPRDLKAVRAKMIEMGWCRSNTNHQINRIRRLLKWGVSEELVPADVFHALQSVSGLRKGMADVRESEPIRPVAEAHVYAALPFMPAAVATMVQLQLLSGSRPGEICLLRPCDLDVSGSTWVYRPATHKTAHHGKERMIPFGPRAQELLRPWLQPELQGYIFSPVASEEARHAERKENRQSPITPSQRRRRRKRNRGRPWGQRYTTASFARAIARACQKADEAAHRQDPSIPADQVIVPFWSPNQLRHTRATQLRREYGLEVARAVLGHSTVETSQLYAERDLNAAAAVMAKIG